MRASETRVAATLNTAVCALIAGAYWSAGRAEGLSPARRAAYAGGLVAGGAACAALGVVALRNDSAAYRRRLIEQVQGILLAPAGASTAPVDDALARPLVSDLRARVDDMQAKIDQLSLHKKNLEIQLRLADADRRRAQTIVAGISDPVLVSDKFDELILANPAAADLFGFDPAAAARIPLPALLHDAPLAADIAELRAAHGRINRRTAEVKLPMNGAEHTFAVSMTTMPDPSGECAGVVTVLHDITRELEVARLKNEFVSHVSHELRTPLSSIKAYAELLVDGEATDDKTRQEFYHVIQAEADRLSRLIDNILNVSRIESGLTRVSKKPMALGGLLKQVLEVAMPSAREKSIALVDNVPPVFQQVDCDRDMIYQAALNLVSNAIKYTPTGGTVRLALAADEVANTLTVTVTDTGVGIPPEAMKHLFSKFYRVEQHKGMAKGSGLGLNLTRQIIETVHKGRMIVQSEPGKGSTFGFVLPIAP